MVEFIRLNNPSIVGSYDNFRSFLCSGNGNGRKTVSPGLSLMINNESVAEKPKSKYLQQLYLNNCRLNNI